MSTRPQRYLSLLQRAKLLESEAAYLRAQAAEVKREMGPPSDDQIERAVDMKQDIRQGCTCDP
jgi:hypothetical protein